MENYNFMPDDRVLVYDYKSNSMKPGTIVCRYGLIKTDFLDGSLGPYTDLCDIKFDHKKEISMAHFTSGIKLLNE